MRLLVLGGTAWLGRYIAAVAVDRGHRVTCLARGESGDAPPGASFTRADRDGPGAYREVACEEWDVVIDVSRQPVQVRCGATGLEVVLGEVPVDAAGGQRGRGGKILADQARPQKGGVSDAKRFSGAEWDTGQVTPEDLAHLRRARDLMDRDYAKPLDVPAMARQALMSPSHFSRQFRAAYGETPWSYLMTRRIERAMALLRRGDLSVTDVCMEVGCTSLGSFSARFTEIVGETPSAYRARCHDATATVPGCVAKVWTRPSRIKEAPASRPA